MFIFGSLTKHTVHHVFSFFVSVWDQQYRNDFLCQTTTFDLLLAEHVTSTGRTNLDFE